MVIRHDSEYQITCKRPLCSFRVPENYFEVKPRFSAGQCPVDGGPLQVVDSGTDNLAVGVRLELATRQVRRVP